MYLEAFAGLLSRSQKNTIETPKTPTNLGLPAVLKITVSGVHGNRYRNWNRVSQDRQSSPTCWWRSPRAPHSYPPVILFHFVHSSVLLCGQGFSMGFHCTARWVRDARRWFQLWRHESSCALCKQARLSEAEMQVMTSVDLQRNDLWQQ